MAALGMGSHGGGETGIINRPHLEVVGSHEEVCNARAHDAENPLVKVLWLGLGDGVGHLGIHQASQALDL